jgi:hypothetical protein
MIHPEDARSDLPEQAHKKLAITRIKIVCWRWQITATGAFEPSPKQESVLERLSLATLRALRHDVESSASPDAARELILRAIANFQQSDNP